MGAGNAVALAHIISRLAQEYRVNVFFPHRVRLVLADRAEALAANIVVGRIGVCLLYTSCGYEYVPELGDEDGEIAPGTLFEQLPAEWVCPECAEAKDQFVKA